MKRLRAFPKIIKLTVLAALAAGVSLFAGSSAWAASPSLVNIGVTTEGKFVTMNARLIDGFTVQIQEAIDSGLPMTFTYEIELREEVSLWADSLISANIVKHTVQYDSLEKVYRFTEIGKNVNRKIKTKDKLRSEQLMLTLKNIPIAPIFRLDPDEKYYVRIKVDLEIDRFWFPFNYIFFFVPFNDFETAWTQSSPLSIDPDLALTKEVNTGFPSQEDGDSKVLKHVIRSFNQ